MKYVLFVMLDNPTALLLGQQQQHGKHSPNPFDYALHRIDSLCCSFVFACLLNFMYPFQFSNYIECVDACFLSQAWQRFGFPDSFDLATHSCLHLPICRTVSHLSGGWIHHQRSPSSGDFRSAVLCTYGNSWCPGVQSVGMR